MVSIFKITFLLCLLTYSVAYSQNLSMSDEFRVTMSGEFERVKTVGGSASIHFHEMIARDGELLKITIRNRNELYLQKFTGPEMKMTINNGPLILGEEFMLYNIIELGGKILILSEKTSNGKYNLLANEIDFDKAELKDEKIINTSSLEVKMESPEEIPYVGMSTNKLNNEEFILYYQTEGSVNGAKLNVTHYNADLEETWNSSVQTDVTKENFFIGNFHFDESGNLYGLGSSYKLVGEAERYLTGFPILNPTLVYISAGGENTKSEAIEGFDDNLTSFSLFSRKGSIYLVGLTSQEEFGSVDKFWLGEVSGTKINSLKSYNVPKNIQNSYLNKEDDWRDVRRNYGNMIGLQIADLIIYDDGTKLIVTDKLFYAENQSVQSLYSSVKCNYETVLAAIKEDGSSNFTKIPVSQATGHFGLGVGNYYMNDDNNFYTFCMDLSQNTNIDSNTEPKEYQIGFDKGKVDYVAFKYNVESNELNRIPLFNIKDVFGGNFGMLNQYKMVQLNDSTFVVEVEDKKRKNSNLMSVEIKD